MKKTMVLTMLLIVSVESFSQQIRSSRGLTKQEYLQKSKHQKTAAIIVLAAGPVLVLTPMLFHPEKAGEATFGIVMATMTAGFLCLPVSIGFFIASSSSKKKAMRLSFKNETAPQLQNSGLINQLFPSLTLKIKL